MTYPMYPAHYPTVGQVNPFPPNPPSPPPAPLAGANTFVEKMAPIYYALGTAGAAVGAYHGYKRNNSVGWAVAWAILGGLAPVIVIPVAYAQGIGKRGPR